MDRIPVSQFLKWVLIELGIYAALLVISYLIVFR